MFNQILKTMKRVLLISAFCFGMISLASAQHTPKINHKQQHQTVRIAHGVKNGELTRPEAKRLAREQKHIQHEKRLAKADGKVTRRERKHIRRDQRMASRDIYRQKHDRQNRH
jgi:hypothetical protein